MKKTKLFITLLAVMILMSATVLVSYAVFEGEVGEIPLMSPASPDDIIIDGTIDTDNEYWAGVDATIVDTTNSSPSWSYRSYVITSHELRFAYTETDLIMAVKTYDDSRVFSYINTEDDLGFDGDTIALQLDPARAILGRILDYSITNNNSPAPFYIFTIMDDGSAKVARYYCGTNSKTEVEGIEIASSYTDTTWTLEAKIPWSVIIDDVKAQTGTELVLEDMYKIGVTHNAKLIYTDRHIFGTNEVYDAMIPGGDEQGAIVTLTRNSTPCNIIPGTSYTGPEGSPSQARNCGIYLYVTDHPCIPGEWEVKVEPNCTTEGINVIKCTECGREMKEENIGVAHAPGQWEETVAPTCIAVGEEVMCCNLCDELLYTREKPIDPTAHKTIRQNIKKATCTESGIIAPVCRLCKKQFPELGIETGTIPHVFTKYVSDDNYTCTEDGTKTAYCDYGCNTAETIIDEGSAAHRYKAEELREPTCKLIGKELHICVCGDMYVTDIDTVEHKFGDYIFNHDSTCTENGTETAYCIYGCAESLTREALDSKHSFINFKYNNDATCTSDGTQTAYCEYGCATFITIPAVGTKAHSYERSVILEPTCTVSGKALNRCICGDYYLEVIPKASHSFGDWKMVEEPTMSEGGRKERVCSICNAVETADIPATRAYVISDGLTVTVGNLSGVKDYFIAAGEYAAYGDINRNKIVRITENKMGNKNAYSYTLPSVGAYSICIRYDNGEVEILHITLKVNEPTFELKADSLTVGNLDGIKVIRVAKGSFDTVSAIKAADGNIAYSGKTVLKGLSEYTLDFAESGTYTVAVVYNNGYTVLQTYTF
ncbi:MAG: hypothetical protein E7591_08555 [Ruminococcaceae bacterium]|nr:hypothetical protein [Oscillospiraceae bacterium]